MRSLRRTPEVAMTALAWLLQGAVRSVVVGSGGGGGVLTSIAVQPGVGGVTFRGGGVEAAGFAPRPLSCPATLPR
jgi:hypothetical protein